MIEIPFAFTCNIEKLLKAYINVAFLSSLFSHSCHSLFQSFCSPLVWALEQAMEYLYFNIILYNEKKRHINYH